MDKKKMAAPIIVTALTLVYYAVYFFLLMSAAEGVWKWALGVIPLVLSVMTVKVCLERLKEIKEGEEDDLGQY